MSEFHPYPWIEFPHECLLYFAYTVIFHCYIFFFGCITLAVLGVLAALLTKQLIKQLVIFLRQFARLGFFLAVLLIVGSIHNGLWSCLIWGRLYYSTDYWIDFFPFWPITQSVIDAEFGDGPGKLLGVSLLQLQLVWLLFASSTWIVTIILYRRICKRLSANK
jgi:hypothetical protein